MTNVQQLFEKAFRAGREVQIKYRSRRQNIRRPNSRRWFSQKRQKKSTYNKLNKLNKYKK